MPANCRGKGRSSLYGDEPANDGYQGYFYWFDAEIKRENYREHDWVKGHAAMHIGGTMRPVQGIPAGFGPCYVEFDEILGGFNFGGGNAQLDFQNEKFDWACG